MINGFGLASFISFKELDIATKVYLWVGNGKAHHLRRDIKIPRMYIKKVHQPTMSRQLKRN